MTIKSLLIFFFFCHATAHAQESNIDTPIKEDAKTEVVVSAMKNPELKPYRVMSAGMDAFDKHRELASQAPLLFKLTPRKGKPQWSEVKLRLAGEDESIPIPISGNGQFSLPRSEKAYDDNAELLLNQKRSSFSFHPDIRTPGLADNALRLGDMRLSCEVLMGMIKKDIGFILTAAISTFVMKIDWCEHKSFDYRLPLPDWAISGKKIDGLHQTVFNHGGNTFATQFWDKSMSKDTIFEFELWSQTSHARKKEVIDQQKFIITTSEKKIPINYDLKPGTAAVYTAEIPLKEGTFNFNVTSDHGVLAYTNSQENVSFEPEIMSELKLARGKSAIKISQAGLYQFTLNLSNPERALFQVRRLDVQTTL
jgi:hypothetical protein